MDMSFVLDSFEEIIEHVLKFVPGKQLHELKNVNLHWHAAAQRLLRKRTKPEWLSCSGKEGTVIARYSDFLDEMYAIPNFILTFSSLQFSKLTCCQRRKCPTKKRIIDFEAFLKRETLTVSNSVQITSYSNICAVAGPEVKNPGPLQHVEKSSATSIFWPNRDDLTVKALTPPFKELRSGSLNHSEEGGKSLKLIMVFATDRCSIDEEVWPVDCVVAGCRVSTLKHNQHAHDALCLAYFGKKNVAVASVVVPPSCIRTDEVAEKLSEFIPFLRRRFSDDDNSGSGGKKNPVPAFDVKKFSNRIHCYAFSCIERIPSAYGDLEAFAKVLPGVPLFGVSGYGEIGMDATSEDGLRSAYGGSSEFVMKYHMHVVSSVFVLVTF